MVDWEKDDIIRWRWFCLVSLNLDGVLVWLFNFFFYEIGGSLLFMVYKEFDLWLNKKLYFRMVKYYIIFILIMFNYFIFIFIIIFKIMK